MRVLSTLRVLLIASPASGPPDLAHADALVLDHAPADMPDWLTVLRRRSDAPPLYVQVDTHTADIAAALALRPDGIVLRRVADGADIARLGVHLSVHEAEAGIADGTVRIIAGLAGARALLRFAGRPETFPRLAGLFCAFDALAHELGIAVPAGDPRDEPWPAPLAQARGLVVLAAAAAGVPAFDVQAFDVPAFDRPGRPTDRRAALAARRDGFGGGFAGSVEAAAMLADVFRQDRDAARPGPDPADARRVAATKGHPG